MRGTKRNNVCPVCGESGFTESIILHVECCLRRVENHSAPKRLRREPVVDLVDVEPYIFPLTSLCAFKDLKRDVPIVSKNIFSKSPTNGRIDLPLFEAICSDSADICGRMFNSKSHFAHENMKVPSVSNAVVHHYFPDTVFAVRF